MLEFVILGLFLFLGVNFLLSPSKIPGALNMKGIEPCPQHKWEYRKITDPISREVRELLYCAKCNKPPGIE